MLLGSTHAELSRAGGSMRKIKVVQHKHKGSISLFVWYKGRPQYNFSYMVRPSHYYLLGDYREELIRNFKLSLI